MDTQDKAVQQVDWDAEFRRAAEWERQGKLPEAAAVYEELERRFPGSAVVQKNLGVLWMRLGRYEDCFAAFDRSLAIDGNQPDIYSNAGIVFATLGGQEDALNYFNRAIELKPDFAEAYSNRSNPLKELGRYEEAVASCGEAIRLRPDYAEAYSNRGAALLAQKRHREAIDSFDEAIRLRPDYAEAYSNRGSAQQDIKQYEAALASFNEAIRLRPDYAKAYYNRGNAYKELGRLDEAVADYIAAIGRQPGFVLACINLGNVLTDLKRRDDAVASYDAAIQLAPDFAEAYWNKALCLLLFGEYREGWKLYEWRFKKAGNAALRPYKEPRLDTPEVRGGTVFLYPEQGLGDTLQFCRYAKLLKEKGAKVILEVQAPLVSVVKTLDPAIEVIPSGATLPRFDCHSPLLSLPFVFGTTLETIPAAMPYLAADPEKSACWKAKLGPRKGLRVGLVWSGGFRIDQPELWGVNERRNIPLLHLAPLNLPSVEYYSLQKGEEAVAQLRAAKERGWGGPEIIDHTDELVDFSDTAALIDNLDLVISVDTSTAHLAGAMNKPVWILNRYDVCWRWLLNREDSPWYPAATLFRQRSMGDWDGVIAEVKARVLAWAKSRT
jgi:tetratricopeptide (TPR) repeat protein